MLEDMFVEKIVKKEKTLLTYALRVLAVAVGLFLISLAASISFLKTVWPILTFAIGYGVWWFFRSGNIEYEYIMTNGDLDVDKITAKSSRKRLTTVKLADIESLGAVQDGRGEMQGQFDETINACGSKDADDRWIIIFTGKKGRTLLIFEPDERMIQEYRKMVPRKILGGRW